MVVVLVTNIEIVRILWPNVATNAKNYDEPNNIMKIKKLFFFIHMSELLLLQ